jgi:NAD(P)-dependent dehydrogenase (short-subunit alcohol dehydrogenase family)
MLLEGKNAVIHGGGGAVGGAIARTFASEGARVFLAGRTPGTLEAVAADVRGAGGTADVAVVDSLDEREVEEHAADVAARAGRIDVAVNAVGFLHVQGVPLAELTLDDYAGHVDSHVRSNFLTARAAVRHMAANGPGVVLTMSTPGARLSGTGFLANGVASAAVEAFSRILAGEVGPRGIRVICLRPDAIPDALATSHTGTVFAGLARRSGTTPEAMLAERAGTAPLLRRLPTLGEVADAAALLASDRAGAMTGAIANLTCGSLVD